MVGFLNKSMEKDSTADEGIKIMTGRIDPIEMTVDFVNNKDNNELIIITNKLNEIIDFLEKNKYNI